jgi:hypothetical protein
MKSTTVMFICSVMVVLSFMGMLIVQDVIELPTIDVPHSSSAYELNKPSPSAGFFYAIMFAIMGVAW